MTHTPEEPSHPLHPGTRVGPWRVEALQGKGAYGAVYRAVRVGQEAAGPVALKMARHPWDARVVREAELLSRLSHPGVPRLLDRGVLRHVVTGAEHPWFAMEWVEGVPLYAWAEQHRPSSAEACRVLAQVARTLEALHAAGAVHRDVKGDNVLVRLSDNFPVLIDFGSGHFQGATRLTWQSLAPGTPAYQSVQAGRFEIGLARNPNSYYAPSPADDLFALGVTAYRVVMGAYPPPIDAQEDEEGRWHVFSPDPRPRLERNSRVKPRLREVILRLLSEVPEKRGTAAQVAEALEALASEGQRPSRQKYARALKAGLALAAVGGCVVLLWSVQPASGPPEAVQVPDAGTAGVGDAPAAKTTEEKPVAQEPLPEPRAEQLRPDGKGRCPGRKQVAINGGCWVEIPSTTAEECQENGHLFLKGRCYTHALAPPQKPPPTSTPPEAR